MVCFNIMEIYPINLSYNTVGNYPPPKSLVILEDVKISFPLPDISAESPVMEKQQKNNYNQNEDNN